MERKKKEREEGRNVADTVKARHGGSRKPESREAFADVLFAAGRSAEDGSPEAERKPSALAACCSAHPGTPLWA